MGCVGSGLGTGFGSVAAVVLMRGQPAACGLVPAASARQPRGPNAGTDLVVGDRAGYAGG